MYFAVTIDTEEDNWGEYVRSCYTVENVRRIPRLQDICNARGVRPTYLVSYPVATSSLAVETLGSYRARDLCEIGTHLHPWNTPPAGEPRTPFNSFVSNLPSSLQYLKIKTLHDTIARNFGVTATSYRSGRWGFNDDVARNLIHLGYTVDTSISPATDWRPHEGPDYSDRSHEPFVYHLEGTAPEQRGSLLEVPATIEFVQSRRALARSTYWTLMRDRKSTRLNSSHIQKSRMPSSA